MNAPIRSFFSVSSPVPFEGPASRNPLAFRHYDPDRVVLGKRMEDHLRFAVCYWHSFCWPGTDPFGGDSFQRFWMQPGDPMQQARAKADIAFELFRLLGVPFFTLHDRDVAPEGANIVESNRNLREMGDILARKMEGAKVRLLWGTANLFSHRRYMAGAATNPDPDIFAYAAAQVKSVLELTHELGGANYVLWGGREGYETLLNTDLGRELDQLGRFLNLVVEHKHRIGFKGTILIEPKPREPTKHQYDFDVASVYGFLVRYGLDKEVKVNIEANHATLAGHSFEHEIALAQALGIFGSIDMNRGDPQLGWDTDQFPNNVQDTALAMYYILQGGGFTDGGLNFDAKIRRQSTDPDDLLHAHIGGMDVSARALLIAEKMITDGALAQHVKQRYGGWDSDEGRAILGGKRSLADLAAAVEARNSEPAPRSGRQEMLENLANIYH
ncbi:xylose isomerase [Dongia sp.]|uniref:xylose isomerase n=1 Tax=Dongia sp. TaxID=1977262 RepID=UPI0035B4D0AE